MSLVEPLRSESETQNAITSTAPISSDLKAQLLRLMSRKDDLEAELEVVASHARHGEPLVDDEGFPRADVDVYTMTHERQHATRLQNDHKQLMNQIEKLMHQLHAQNKGKPQPPRSSADTTGAQTSQQQRPASDATNKPAKPTAESEPTTEAAAGEVAGAGAAAAAAAAAALPSAAATPAEAFYVVNSVVEDSPASQSGLKTGDKIFEFGSITKRNWSGTAIASIVQNSVGRDIHVRVYRVGEGIKQIRLVPQANWGGRGLLGCHLIEC